MADKTGIEWTEATWNPLVGCSLKSPGCTNCYAMSMAARIQRMTPGSHYVGTTQKSKAGPVWTGLVKLAPDHILTQPLRWSRPRKIFVNSMSDLFHESVPDEWIDRIFAIMALAPQHTFQVLTKRSERMREYMSAADTRFRVRTEYKALPAQGTALSRQLSHLPLWPLPNVWLGVSVEDQARADERIPDLLATPAAVRWISAEPLLGELDLESAWHGENALDSECWGDCAWCKNGLPPLHNCQRGQGDWEKGRSGLDWVVAGGESGRKARPMHPDWARSIRDQCAAAGTPFLFKQWGEFHPADQVKNAEQIAATGDIGRALRDGHAHAFDDQWTWRIGKKRAGRLLDGIEHNGYPEAR